MTIHLAEHYGICFGVRDALALAERIANDQPLTILGQLVHNPIARERLDALGVQQGALEDSPASVTHRVMITAHGASDAARARWQASGHTVDDATCPLVRHAHGQFRRLVEEGCFPVIIGKHGHVEVQGLAGDFPDAAVLETEADLGRASRSIRSTALYRQTTQPSTASLPLVVALRASRPNSRVRFRDTVCRPTKDRQEALRNLMREVELVIVVGGRNSNNTRELVETVRAAGLPRLSHRARGRTASGVVRAYRTCRHHRRNLDPPRNCGPGASPPFRNGIATPGGPLMDAAQPIQATVAVPKATPRFGSLLLSRGYGGPCGLLLLEERTGPLSRTLRNRPGGNHPAESTPAVLDASCCIPGGAHLRGGGGIGHRPLLFECPDARRADDWPGGRDLL